MRIGIWQGADRRRASLDDVIELAKRTETAGLDAFWMAHIRGLDAISALTVAARETKRIELGTAVTPIYPHHPMALAQQALTANHAAQGRFTLGVGASHRMIVESMLGLSFDHPGLFFREYVSVLETLLRGDPVEHDGAAFSIHGLQIDIPNTPRVHMIAAALGPLMLKTAGQFTDGTHLWMVGAKTIESFISPRLSAAASQAGRPAPRVVAAYPVVLTTNIESARDLISRDLGIYGKLPSFRATLDREGITDPSALALVGDAPALEASLMRLARVGVTDFNAVIMDTEPGAFDRTFDFLSSMAGRIKA